MFILSIDRASFTPIGLRNYSTTGVFPPKFKKTFKKRDYYFGVGTPDRSKYYKFAVRYVFDKGATLPKRAYLVSEFGSTRFDLDKNGVPNKIFFTQHTQRDNIESNEPLIFKADIQTSNNILVTSNMEVFKINSGIIRDDSAIKGRWEPIEHNPEMITDAIITSALHYNMYIGHARKAYSEYSEQPPHLLN